MILIVLLVVLALIVFYFIGVYSGLIRGRLPFENALAQIDVQLTRRCDLIPNLVEVAKGYMKHERETLDAVIRARAGALGGIAEAKANPADPAALRQLGAAEGQLNQALGRLLAVSEAYPDLKANQN